MNVPLCTSYFPVLSCSPRPGTQVVRLFIGISLCNFVCCQFWVGSMFNVNIVGTANAVTAGW